ncbi:MAG: hypothetical protein AABW82_04945 [Nanoarchaeota archaeon]
MSAQDDRNYNDEPRIYVPKIANPWRITVVKVERRLFGIGFYSPSEDLHIAEDLDEVRQEIGRLEFPGRVLALARKPYFLGLNRREEKYISDARTRLLREIQQRRAEFS